MRWQEYSVYYDLIRAVHYYDLGNFTACERTLKALLQPELALLCRNAGEAHRWLGRVYCSKNDTWLRS